VASAQRRADEGWGGQMTHSFDPVREAEEFREQLGSDRRRLMFFFGAGTSQAVGLEGIVQLTKSISAELKGNDKGHYDRLLKKEGANVETILSTVRLYREIIDGGEETAGGFKGKEAEDLDRAICAAIYRKVTITPPKGFSFHAEFAGWLNSIERSKPVEIFSTNYDLLFERGLEIAEVPYFDGFVGAVEPYFSDAAVDFTNEQSHKIPRSWLRLWKIHGSVGWKAKVEEFTGAKKVIRVPLVAPDKTDDIMIFPSREKYTDSRKLPFIALQDRLRRATGTGEGLLVVAGYSFSDEHINDIIFSNLRANNRFSATVLLFDQLSGADIKEKLLKPAKGLRNLTVYAPDGALVGGVQGTWSEPTKKPDGSDKWPFWDEEKKQFTLGDFACLPKFLREFLGARPLAAAPDAGGAA